MAQPLTNDIQERARRIARQFTAPQLLEVAAEFVRIAGTDLDCDPFDYSVEFSNIESQLDMIADQVEGVRNRPSGSYDDWYPSLSAAQLGMAS